MLLAEVRWNDQVRHPVPEHLRPRIPERLLGGWIELRDGSGVVHADNRIEGRVDDRRLSLLGALAFREIGDDGKNAALVEHRNPNEHGHVCAVFADVLLLEGTGAATSP